MLLAICDAIGRAMLFIHYLPISSSSFNHLSLLILRETKLIQKCNNHLQNTAQRLEDENALMSSCFYNLEDDIVEHERRAARMHLIRNEASFDQLIAINKISATESKVREAEDVEVLDTLIDTQKLLQETVSTFLLESAVGFVIIIYLAGIDAFWNKSRRS